MKMKTEALSKLSLDDKDELLQHIIYETLYAMLINPVSNSSKAEKFSPDAMSFEEFDTFISFNGVPHSDIWVHVQDTDMEEAVNEYFGGTEDEVENHGDFSSAPLKLFVAGDYEKVVIKNVAGFNEDDRSHSVMSSGRGDWLNMDSYTLSSKEWSAFQAHKGKIEYDISQHPTILDLVKRILYVKGSRFDRHYEMYLGVKSIIKDNVLYLEVDFDHGS